MQRKFLGIRPWTRHSLVLLVAGLVYIGLGIAIIFADVKPDSMSAVQLAATAWLPWDAWGVIWILVGGMAIMSTRWPPASKTWGYSAMTGLAVAWACFYIVGVIVLSAPDYQINGALVWGLVGFMWWGISGLVAPEDKAD